MQKRAIAHLFLFFFIHVQANLIQNGFEAVIETESINRVHIPAGPVKEYTRTIYDTHDAFDLASGLFLVPQTGIYEFRIDSARKGRGKMEVWLNSNVYTKFSFTVDSDEESYDHTGAQWTMELTSGDTVNLKIDEGETGFYVQDHYGYPYNRFSFKGSMLEFVTDK